MDPCELRLAKGDAAVRDLVARREPLFAFALRSVLRQYDLDTAEGRVAALREAAPMVAKIKDRALRPEYARKLAGDLGMDVEPVNQAVAAASGGVPVEPVRRAQVVAPNDPALVVEREALKLALQTPVLAGPVFDLTEVGDYLHPVHAALRSAIAEVGGASSATNGAAWIEKVREACSDLGASALVGELAVEPLRITTDVDPKYVTVTMARLRWSSVMRQLAELKSKLQRVNPVTNRDEYLTMAGELFSLEQHARALREQAVGGL
jgi:DNA primase